MPTRIHNTGITFPDSSTQTTAGGPVVDQYAIGSYVMGRPQNISTTYNNSTVAGSTLYAAPPWAIYSNAEGGVQWRTGLGNSGSLPGGSISLVNTGSWRCVSIAAATDSQTGSMGLWVRYA
jgi:hypothetical protein